jgi:hypothetical protein
METLKKRAGIAFIALPGEEILEVVCEYCKLLTISPAGASESNSATIHDDSMTHRGITLLS